jgi:hypothetical protein
MFEKNKKMAQYFLWGGVIIIALGFILILKSFIGPLSEKSLATTSLSSISFNQTVLQAAKNTDLTQFSSIAYPQEPVGKNDPLTPSSSN